VWRDVDTTLYTRLLTFIERASVPVSYEILRNKATHAGYTTHQLTEALQRVHKTQGVKMTQKDDTIYYQHYTPQIKERKEEAFTAPSVPHEERARRRKVVDDFINYSALVSDEEREMWHTNHDYRTCTCTPCEQVRPLFMAKQKTKC